MRLQKVAERAKEEKKVRLPQEPQTANAPDAFLELFELLETYAPTWYTEEHHSRVVAALRVRGS
jgi:hypothetical protein